MTTAQRVKAMFDLYVHEGRRLGKCPFYSVSAQNEWSILVDEREQSKDVRWMKEQIRNKVNPMEYRDSCTFPDIYARLTPLAPRQATRTMKHGEKI